MNTPSFLVSIHCMTYNHASYIEDAMNGFCMQQTDFPFVAIIVDDASTDGEPEVIRRYLNAHFDMEQAELWETDDAHFVYAQHQENKNCFFAVILLKYNFWQAKKAKGPLMKRWTDTKYVALCEGDDYWTHPEKLQKQVIVLERFPEVSVCCHDFISYYQKNGCFDKASHYDMTKMSFNGKDFFRFAVSDHFHKHIIQTLSIVYRKGDYLRKLHRNKYKYFRDQVFEYYLLKAGDGIALNYCMGVYRRHKGGIATGISEERRIEIRLKQWYDIYHVENEKELYPVIIWNGHELLKYTLENYGMKKLFKEIIYLYGELSHRIATTILFNFTKYAISQNLQ